MHPRFERFIQGMNELTARPAVGEEDILREGRVLLGEPADDAPDDRQPPPEHQRPPDEVRRVRRPRRL